MIGTASIHESVFLEKHLIPNAIQTFIFFLIDIFFASPPHFLRSFLVMSIRCANKMQVLRQSERLFEGPEFCSVFIYMSLGIFSFVPRSLVYFLAMFICPGVEKHIVPK